MSETSVFGNNEYSKPYDTVLKKAADDAAFKEVLQADPVQQLQQAGLDVAGLSPENSELIATQIRACLQGTNALSALQGPIMARAKATDDTPYVQVEARPWGVVFTLSDQAVSDLSGGISIAAAITAAAAAAGGVPGVAVAIVSAFISVSVGILNLVNRGNGVYLTIPWSSFIPWPNPTFGAVIPTPVL